MKQKYDGATETFTSSDEEGKSNRSLNSGEQINQKNIGTNLSPEKIPGQVELCSADSLSSASVSSKSRSSQEKSESALNSAMDFGLGQNSNHSLSSSRRSGRKTQSGFRKFSVHTDSVLNTLTTMEKKLESLQKNLQPDQDQLTMKMQQFAEACSVKKALKEKLKSESGNRGLEQSLINQQEMITALARSILSLKVKIRYRDYIPKTPLSQINELQRLLIELNYEHLNSKPSPTWSLFSSNPRVKAFSSVERLKENQAFKYPEQRPLEELQVNIEILDLMTLALFPLSHPLRELPELDQEFKAVIQEDLAMIKQQSHGLIRSSNATLQFWGNVLMALGCLIAAIVTAAVVMSLLGVAAPAFLIPYLTAIQSSSMISALLNFVAAKLTLDLSTAAVVTAGATAGTLGLFGKTMHALGAPTSLKTDLDRAVDHVTQALKEPLALSV